MARSQRVDSAAVAPEWRRARRLVGLKVLDAHGQGRVSDVLNAIEFAVANRHRLRIDVLNLSVGHPATEAPEDDPLVQAVERATRAGLIVVASAGNAHPAGLEAELGLGVTSPGDRAVRDHPSGHRYTRNAVAPRRHHRVLQFARHQ